MYPGGSLTYAMTYNVLSCDVMRDFWLSWSDDMVAIGEGRVVNEDILVRHTDLNGERAIHALTFRTDYQVNGTWEFPEYEGENRHKQVPSLNPCQMNEVRFLLLIYFHV